MELCRSSLNMRLNDFDADRKATAGDRPLSPLTLPTRIRVMRELSDAVAFLHACGVVHRDLKPENVLLDDRDRVKLSDFGTAKSIASQQSTMAGTLSYHAPELLLNGPPFTPATDVYALALVFFHILTGERPFASIKIPAQVMIAVLDKKRPTWPKPIADHSTLRPLRELVEAMWSDAPDKRPAAAHIFATLEKLDSR
jgi:eukaryotic-like serine/threonine-protein kinase